MATQTRKKQITDVYSEIADSGAGDAAVTIHNLTEHTLSYFVDHRTPAERDTASDNIALTIRPGGKESFAAFSGKVQAKFASQGDKGDIAVVVS